MRCTFCPSHWFTITEIARIQQHDTINLYSNLPINFVRLINNIINQETLFRTSFALFHVQYTMQKKHTLLFVMTFGHKYKFCCRHQGETEECLHYSPSRGYGLNEDTYQEIRLRPFESLVWLIMAAHQQLNANDSSWVRHTFFSLSAFQVPCWTSSYSSGVVTYKKYMANFIGGVGCKEIYLVLQIDSDRRHLQQGLVFEKHCSVKKKYKSLHSAGFTADT